MPCTLMEALLGFTNVGKSHSPLHTMSQCLDRIPIFYKGVVAVIYPHTHQTLRNTIMQTSLFASRASFKEKHGRTRFLSYTYSAIQNWDRHALFGPKDIQPMITRSFPGSRYEECTPQARSNILISAASRCVLQTFSSELSIPSMAHIEKGKKRKTKMKE